jgi:calcium-dependent protein kinase
MKLVHRDLKPENIILEGNSLDNIKLIDFGTANIISPNQKFKERLGTAYYIAPEVLKKNYDEKCDLWSIGVIMYILLTGEPPFNGENDEEILRNVKTGIVNFSSPIFEEVTKDAKDLLKKLLHITPSKRISAVCALEHPWIKNLAPNMMMKPEIAKKVFENLQSFQANQKLQEATVAFIVNQLISREEIKGLRELFVELDTNCDGVLSREELESGLTLYYGKDNAKKQTELIFMNVDADKNGFISYDEFVRASVDKVKLLSEEKLKAAYGLFDKNGDGGIEAKEIKEVLGRDLADNTDGIWKEIVNEVDKNGDGIISYEEFKEMMENICKR